MAKEDMHLTFVSLFSMTWVAGLLAGSSLQWVIARGLFTKRFRDPNNQYNIIVFVAASSAGLLAPFNFFLYYLAPDTNFAYSVYLLFNWMVMTHSSVMLVSKKLSITYRNPDLVWRRLLWINWAMLPVSLLVCITWGGNTNSDNPVFYQISKIVEPVQMSLWGLIEFVLSGLFIVKMWAFQWTKVERQGIFVLVLVGICDVMSVVSNIVLGDYESTVVKAFVYCLRIRLEVGVLCTMADFLNRKRRGSVYESKSLSKFGASSFMLKKAEQSGPIDIRKQWGLTSSDLESPRVTEDSMMHRESSSFIQPVTEELQEEDEESPVFADKTSPGAGQSTARRIDSTGAIRETSSNGSEQGEAPRESAQA